MDKILSKLRETKAVDIMKKDVVVIDADSPAGDAAKIMLKNKIHGLPVVKSGAPDEALSMITSFDLLGLTYYGRFSEDTEYIKTTKVSEFTKEQKLISVSPETSLMEILQIMAKYGIRTVPVVDNGKLAGLVSVIDIIKLIAGD